MPTDIAVVEGQGHDGAWEIIAYIGPDRLGGEIEQHYFWDKIRIRYLVVNKRDTK